MAPRQMGHCSKKLLKTTRGSFSLDFQIVPKVPQEKAYKLEVKHVILEKVLNLEAPHNSLIREFKIKGWN